MNVVGRSHATLIKTLVGAGQTAVLQLNSQGYIIRNVTILKEPGTSFGMSLGDGKGKYQQVLAVVRLDARPPPTHTPSTITVDNKKSRKKNKEKQS